MTRTLCLTACLALAFVSPAVANFPLAMPELSGTGLAVTGHPDDGFGITGFSRMQQNQPDSGHPVENVVLNAPVFPEPYVNRAHYYITGIQSSPYAAGQTDTAFATGETNMANLQAVMAGAPAYEDITFRLGQTGGAGLADSWSLGGDVLNDDWTGSMESSIEERIYQANPNDVQAALFYLGTEIVVFDYSPVFEILDYGPTDAGDDDEIRAYSEPVQAFKAAGLNGDADAIADAFLADVTDGGGLVQLRFDTFQTITYIVDDQLEYTYGDFSFDGEIMVVPEPASVALFLGLAVSGVLLVRRRRGSCNS